MAIIKGTLKRKVTDFPLTTGMSLTKLSLAARESLVSDIPAKDGKTTNLLLLCSLVSECLYENLPEGREGGGTSPPPQ
jgi:hypothetical protein